MGAGADHRGDEEALGGGEEGRAAGSGWPDEGGAEATGRRHGIAEGTPAACPASCPHSMPLTVLDRKGISATCRERIEAAVEVAGQRLAQPYEAWIAADLSQGGTGFSSPGRGVSKGRSRSRSTKRPSAS